MNTSNSLCGIMKGRYVDWCRHQASGSGVAIELNSPKAVSDTSEDFQRQPQFLGNSAPSTESTLAKGNTGMAPQEKANSHSGKSDLQASPEHSGNEPSNGASDSQRLLAAAATVAGFPAAGAATIANGQYQLNLSGAPLPRTLPWPDYKPALGPPLNLLNGSLPFPGAAAAGVGMNMQGKPFTMPAVDSDGRMIEIRWNPSLCMWVPVKPPAAQAIPGTATAAAATSTATCAAASNQSSGIPKPAKLAVRVNSDASRSSASGLARQGGSPCESPAVPSTVAGIAAGSCDGSGRAGGKHMRGNLAPKTHSPLPAASAEPPQASSSSSRAKVPGVRKPRKSRAKPKPVLPASEAWWAQAR